MNIFVDTQIWVYAFKKPAKEKFSDLEKFKAALDMHERARKFLRKALEQDTIFLTTHQLAEIFHAMAFRGIKMNPTRATRLIGLIVKSTKTVIIDPKRRHYLESLKLSSLSGIHVWDFLCILPLKGKIDVAYTNDKHFKHPYFTKIIPKIKNPLGIWIEI